MSLARHDRLDARARQLRREELRRLAADLLATLRRLFRRAGRARAAPLPCPPHCA